MIRFRVVVAALISVAVFTWSDVLIWQRLVEGRDWLPVFDGRYHDGMRVLLAGLCISGFVLLWPRKAEAVFYPAFILLLYHGGLADILYYWLDGQALPSVLPWLDNEWHHLILFRPVTDVSLVSNVVFLVTWWFLAWRLLSMQLATRPRKREWQYLTESTSGRPVNENVWSGITPQMLGVAPSKIAKFRTEDTAWHFFAVAEDGKVYADGTLIDSGEDLK